MSASESGIRTLPYILAVCESPLFPPYLLLLRSRLTWSLPALSVIVAGQGVTATGYAVPWMTFGGVLATIGAGLIYTFDLNSPARTWIGYQILGGLGVGLSFQIPVMLVQSTTREKFIPQATANLLFLQTTAGAFGVSAAQAAFQNKLLQQLPVWAPEVNPFAILHAGATDITKLVPPDSVQGVLQAYVEGFRETLIVAIALSGASVISTLGFRMTTISKIRTIEDQEEDEEQDQGVELGE